MQLSTILMKTSSGSFLEVLQYFFMKLFHTVNSEIITDCQASFRIDSTTILFYRGLEFFYTALGHVNLIRNYYYYNCISMTHCSNLIRPTRWLRVLSTLTARWPRVVLAITIFTTFFVAYVAVSVTMTTAKHI